MQTTSLLLRVEIGTYRYVMMPLVARLPSRAAYRLGRIAGDLQYQLESTKRRTHLKCVEFALGEQLGPEGGIRVVHDSFRLRACEEIDRSRLSGNGRLLAQLVNIRGLEHVESALARGKGAIIGSAHFGSWEAAVGLLGVFGYPVTLITRRSSTERAQIFASPGAFFRAIRNKTLKEHLRGPNIVVPRRGGNTAVVEATRVLEQNGLVFTMLDVVDTPSLHPNAAPVPFLNGLAYVPNGACRIAKSTGAPLLICFIRRSGDWRHQVMEISAPIPTEGDSNEVNRRCVGLIEEAIRREPAHWQNWSELQRYRILGQFSSI